MALELQKKEETTKDTSKTKFDDFDLTVIVEKKDGKVISASVTGNNTKGNYVSVQYSTQNSASTTTTYSGAGGYNEALIKAIIDTIVVIISED